MTVYRDIRRELPPEEWYDCRECGATGMVRTPPYGAVATCVACVGGVVRSVPQRASAAAVTRAESAAARLARGEAAADAEDRPFGLTVHK